MNLFYEKVGKGNPILFLPGLGLNHHLFDDTVKELKDNFQLILVDPYGTGNSPKPETNYSFKLDAEEVFKIVKDYDELRLIAHSRGVKVSLRLSEIYQNIKKAVFVGQAGFGKNDDIFKKNVEEIRKNGENLSKKEFGRKLESGLNFGKVFGDVETLTKLKKAKENSDVIDAVLRREEDDCDFKKLAEEANFEVNFVIGEKDPFLDDVKDALSVYPNANLFIINNSGHFPMIEKSEDFKKIVKRIFMEEKWK
jgi:pimeloyl-ACP methyl ester carboxylesterase